MLSSPHFAQQEHTRSWYAASCAPPPTYLPLNSVLDVDVCVIGGGYTGLSAALELAERGLSVVLLEGARIGWGASGRNGGQVLNDVACGMDEIRAQLGDVDARAIWGMTQEAVALIGDRCQRYSIDAELSWGYLHAALKTRHMRALAQWQLDAAQRYGYHDLRLIEWAQLPEMIASARYIGGLYDPHSGHLHPLKYALGLARAAHSAGVRLFEHSAVTRMTAGDTVQIDTAQGQVRAAQVVLACNSYVGDLAPALSRKMMPVGTYIIATEPLGTRAQALLPDNIAVCDCNFVLDYFRLSSDQRLLFGGRVSYSGLTPNALQNTMRRSMLRVFPQLADTCIDYAWGGFVDISMNRAPHFGRLAQNIYFAQGFSGHGVALTGLAGRLIAEAITGAPERFDTFARLKHRDFPGGRWLRTPALVLAMQYYKWRDWC